MAQIKSHITKVSEPSEQNKFPACNIFELPHYFGMTPKCKTSGISKGNFSGALETCHISYWLDIQTVCRQTWGFS